MSKLVRSIKNVASGYTTTQVKVRNATSNDMYGPTILEMEEISQLTYQNYELLEIMDMVDKRLNDKGKNWRHVMKSLVLLDYLLHCGSESVVLWCKDNIYIIKTLREFQYVDETGADHGKSIRIKAKEMTSLLLDDDKLRAERSDKKQWKKNLKHDAMPYSPNTGYGQQASSGRQNNLDNRRRERNRRYSQSNNNNETDEDLLRAIEESKLTAEQEKLRKLGDEGDDEDIRMAIMLSKEEEQQREMNQQASGLYTDIPPQSSNNPFDQYQQQPQQQFFMGEPIYQQVDVNGNPFELSNKQTTAPTGSQQGTYSVIGNGIQYASDTGLYNFQPQVQSPILLSQQQLQQQPAPLQPLKTGSNNPFAQNNLDTQSTSQIQTNNKPTLAQLQQTHQNYAQSSNLPQQYSPMGSLPMQNASANPIVPRKTGSKYDELNELLSSKDGLDTYGNAGELRLPAQHTKTEFVNNALQPQQTAGGSKNPFIGQQYTGVPSANNLQPSYTGYGFGNSINQEQSQPIQQQNTQQQYDQQQNQYSQQQYIQQQHHNNYQGKQQPPSLIDL
ncbi:ENTH-domain-containing protein [Nadsonia fulvescens var. elongata DSM 6958]|uniref:ENTH-domain-containing protein n=1 Tax=Nadsonia fulvescens var. elongata DSM 6958 TaxID=857566 RepID=A0A1E3PLC2_9ASCO|nr:ENTH-domain-containing protein [Nadsonia fulvescens var. elongata DSM 6958]